MFLFKSGFWSMVSLISIVISLAYLIRAGYHLTFEYETHFLALFFLGRFLEFFGAGALTAILCSIFTNYEHREMINQAIRRGK